MPSIFTTEFNGEDFLNTGLQENLLLWKMNLFLYWRISKRSTMQVKQFEIRVADLKPCSLFTSHYYISSLILHYFINTPGWKKPVAEWNPVRTFYYICSVWFPDPFWGGNEKGIRWKSWTVPAAVISGIFRASLPLSRPWDGKAPGKWSKSEDLPHRNEMFGSNMKKVFHCTTESLF